MDKLKPLVLGVLGGMGTYATIHFFQQYAEVFQAEKEWDRPRIVIDNNCTMPSRVRAFLYGEKRKELVEQMASSLMGLKREGANRLILACNTSHLFLDEVYETAPEVKELVVHIIDACVERLIAQGIKKVYLLATEGTLLSGVYQQKLQAVNILCECPETDEFPLLRECIEAVKQNRVNPQIQRLFIELLNRAEEACILGCTELPIIYDQLSSQDKDKVNCQVIDPLYLALEKVYRQYEQKT